MGSDATRDLPAREEEGERGFMQAIHQYLSTNDLWAIAAIAAVVVILALNCSYQKRRTLVRDRIDRRLAPVRDERHEGHGVGAHA